MNQNLKQEIEKLQQDIHRLSDLYGGLQKLFSLFLHKNISKTWLFFVKKKKKEKKKKKKKKKGKIVYITNTYKENPV